MTRTYAFRTSDVFTSKAFTGNQLGIIIVPSTNPLTQAEKQAIAIEFNYSESIFVHESTSTTTTSQTPTVNVDIFTPQSELPFAGHPTIGAIHHILTYIYPDHDEVIINLKAGKVIGRLDRATGFASAEIPQAFHRHVARIDWGRLGKVQPGVKVDDAGLKGSHALVSIVQGMNFGLVELSEKPELLRAVAVTSEDVWTAEELDEGWDKALCGTVFYVRKGDQADGVVRVDQRVVVIGLEDPATGSASCALTGHLAMEMGGMNETHQFELVQGEQMGRRSVILTKVTLDESGKQVKKIMMSGQCKSVMKGELEF